MIGMPDRVEPESFEHLPVADERLPRQILIANDPEPWQLRHLASESPYHPHFAVSAYRRGNACQAVVRNRRDSDRHDRARHRSRLRDRAGDRARLSAAGARVVVTELPDRLERAEATVSELQRAGGDALAVELDVRILDSISACVDAVVQAGEGRLDILVNNAGLNVRQPAFDVTEDAWDLVLDTNLKGCSSPLRPRAGSCAIRIRLSSIINVSSVMGLVGYFERAAYCSSKAGVINLSRVLAIEWAPHEIG